MRGLAGALLVLASVAAAGEAGDAMRCVRGSPTIVDALDQIAGLLGAADVKSVVFVFEQNDFGKHERLFDEADYHAQLPEWLERIGAFAAKQDGVRIALTGSSKPMQPRASAALLDDARRAYPVAPEKWLDRLAHFSKGKAGALVYIADAPRSRWGNEGVLWDPEQVAAKLNRSGARLYVVMPEARFFEFLPAREFVDLPTSWWRSPRASPSSGEFYDSWAYETDCPSAYGVAAYARAAAATRGAYVFYPGRAKDWLDPCPFNVGLLTELLPTMPSAADLAQAAAADPVLKEIAESTRRCKPLTEFESGVDFSLHDAAQFGKLAPSARANADLCAAEADRLAAIGAAAEKGELKGASRRSLAQIRYSRFLLEVGSFHCAAWADSAETVEAFVAKGEGRAEYQKAGLKVNLWQDRWLHLKDLVTPISEYARRDKDQFAPAWDPKGRIESVPAALRGRAKRVVAAAEDVLKHEGLSPWGWMVYYTDIVTFAPGWEGDLKARDRRRKPDSEGTAPTTPPDPKPAPGSGGAGPTTGG